MDRVMEPKGIYYIADSRNMAEVPDESVHLIITSPPYWHLKDYGIESQIGYGQSLHEYLWDLSRVWKECWRVLQHGRRLCINVGDQFARSTAYGRYKVIPLHAEIIAQCEAIGFDYMGAIIWQKKTTMHTTGGAVVMGSFPYPPQGVVEIDYEYILIFKKPERKTLKKYLDQSRKEHSKLTLEEWKTFFSGHWNFAGERQALHEAMFPEELPYRLIRMFSFVGETVLDPFAGSGTTIAVALKLQRRAVGYEIQPAYTTVLQQRLGMEEPTLFDPPVAIVYRETSLPLVDPPPNYRPMVQDARPTRNEPHRSPSGRENTHKIIEVLDELHLKTDTGFTIKLLGIHIPPEKQQEALDYLRQYVRGKQVFLRFPVQEQSKDKNKVALSYLYLANRLFVNRKMIEMGLADADRTVYHPFIEKFLIAEEKRNGKRVGSQ